MPGRGDPGWGLVVLRASFGLIFLVHGWVGLFGGDGGAAGAFAPGAVWLVAALEAAGGLLLLIGWLTRWAGAVLFVEILVALVAGHSENGFFVFRPYGEWGYEYHIALLGGLGCLVLAGGGRLSVDDGWARRVAGRGRGARL